MKWRVLSCDGHHIQSAAEYFYAGTAADLKKVYNTLSTRLALEKKETEIAGIFALVAAAFAMVAAGLSLAWFGRVM